MPRSPLGRGGPGLTETSREYDEALALVRTLATPTGWDRDNFNRSPYRPYSFPRSALLAAIEEAVAESAPAGGSGSASGGAHAGKHASRAKNSLAGERPDQGAAFRQLTRLRRRKPADGSLSLLRSLMAVLMPAVAVVLSVELTTLSTPKLAPLVLLLTGLVILISWGVLVFRQILTAPLSGLFPASHWFTTSTFIFAADQRISRKSGIPVSTGVCPCTIRRP